TPLEGIIRAAAAANPVTSLKAAPRAKAAKAERAAAAVKVARSTRCQFSLPPVRRKERPRVKTTPARDGSRATDITGKPGRRARLISSVTRPTAAAGRS